MKLLPQKLIKVKLHFRNLFVDSIIIVEQNYSCILSKSHIFIFYQYKFNLLIICFFGPPKKTKLYL
jgi:hypothetical protein